MSARTQLKPRKSAVQARSKETVRAILQAAVQVFEQFGYAAGTTDRIAERAGVSVGTLYQYFPNKDAVLVTLARNHIEEGFGLLRERLAAHRDSRERRVGVIVRDLVHANVELHLRNPQLHRLLFEEAPLPPDVHNYLNAEERRFMAETRLFLIELAKRARVRTDKPAVYLLVQTGKSLAHSLVLHPPAELDQDALVDEIALMLERYLTAPAPRAR